VFSDILLLCKASELTEICQKASLLPGYIRSYQFTGTLDARFHNRHDAPTTTRVEFWQSGSNIRVTTELLVSPGKQVDPLVASAIYAYNGSRYQWFIPGNEALSFSKRCRHPTPYWTQNPIILPYYWFAGGQVNWSDLKDKESWIKRFEDARYEGEKIENKMTFKIVSFSFPPMTSRIQVYFAKDLDYYPLKFSGHEQNKGSLITEVKRYTLIDVDGQKTVFPLEVVMSEGTKTEGLSITGTIDEKSLNVNLHIDEDLFTLSPAMAKTVYDYDKELKKIEPYSSDDDLEPSRWTLKRFFLIVIINGIIIIIIVLIFLRRIWRNRK
jgi:hypothetical protein